ncbi:MAG: hypothetical protein GF346_11770 [Candidatus Eisenbacteria bacterium]|nr:hypothetical protein [Candidatus Latescibacterota bacterium]MBD3303114.1 hypothetical protein [Candidatus Eisenbacteria bacterium]
MRDGAERPSIGTGDEGIRLGRRIEAFETAVDELAAAPPFAKARYQTQVHRLAGELLDSDAGIRRLLALSPRISDAGTFHGGPWEHASRLLPRLVGYGLRGEGVHPTIEALSELRMLAIATGAHREDGVGAEEAERFLQQVCVQNLDLMFPTASEEHRARAKIYGRAERLLNLIRENISVAGFGATLIDEIETIGAQRPILTHRVQKLLELARQLPQGTLSERLQGRLGIYLRATGAVTKASAEAGTPERYGEALRRMPESEIDSEAREFSRSLHATGLGSPFHSILIRHLRERIPGKLETVLGLQPVGAACLNENRDLVHAVVDAAIRSGTEWCVLGLAQALDRGLFSRPEIRAGMRRVLTVPLTPAVQRRLLALGRDAPGLDARALFVAGTVSVLGMPLGIDQGNNPTCQAARGLSLWSQHAPGLLLKILVRAARDGVLHTHFEQHELIIRDEPDHEAGRQLDLDLDPVSAVLVPLLDRLYAQLMVLAQGRAFDAHRWVNPAMYGNWVPGGFSAAFDPITGAVSGHEGFVRLFYATHHPTYNGGYDLLYPNPVGIIITDVHGNMLGYHAISIQRIAEGPDGGIRVYFFNPNNEGRQRWGHGVAPTVAGNGEAPGESSLPFDQFTSRLYAYHYDPYEKREEGRVPAPLVAEITRMARESWGRAVTWIPSP